MRRTRVLVADDDAAMREVLVDLIAGDPTLEVAGEASDGYQALEQVTRHRPDVVLLDVRMAGGGARTATEIRRSSPRTRIVALTAYSDRATVLAMIRAGACGYLVKGGSADEVLSAIHGAMEDKAAVSPEVTAELIRELAGKLEWDEKRDTARREWSSRLHSVLQGDVLRSVLQPIVDLHTGRIKGTEALLRVEAEPRQAPDAWLAQAQAAGVQEELELTALRLALAHRATLPPDVYLAVNLSPDVMLDPRSGEALAAVDATSLVIEITEHAKVRDYEELSAALQPLRARGARVSVDDAGAGFASLRHILLLEPDIIKIDISLTRDIHLDRRRRALAAALISFAEEIGASVVAEGVEIQEELDTLRDLGVGYGQGYLLGRPGCRGDAEMANLVDVGLAGRPARSTLTGLREKTALIDLLQTAIRAREADSVEEALQLAVDHICAFTRWPVGHALLVDPANGALVSAGVWHVDPKAASAGFQLATEAIRWQPGVGVPGEVLAGGSAVLAKEVDFSASPRREEARKAGLVSGFGFPLLHGGRVVGVLEFFCDLPDLPGQPLLEVLAAFGLQLGGVIQGKRAELETQAAHQQLADAQALAHVGSWHAPTGGAPRLSDEICRILGTDRAQAPGTYVEMLARVHPDDQEAIQAAVRQSALLRRAVAFDCRVFRPDGAVVDLHGQVRALLDPDGRVAGSEGVVQDVTEMHRAERALRRQARVTDLVADTVAEGVVVVDAQGHLLGANKAADDLLGLRREDTDPAEWSLRYHLRRPDGSPYATEELPLWRAMHGQAVDLANVVVDRPDRPGGVRLKVTGRPLLDEHGSLEGGVIVFADVTEQPPPRPQGSTGQQAMAPPEPPA